MIVAIGTFYEQPFPVPRCYGMCHGETKVSLCTGIVFK